MSQDVRGPEGRGAEQTGEIAPDETSDAARDQLLRLLLNDPDEAVRALVDFATGAPAGSSAARLLRSGVDPAVCARVCGLSEGEMARLAAQDIGAAAGRPLAAGGPARA